MGSVHPSCAEMNSAMQGFTDVAYTTSEQHKDTTSPRLIRDSNDTDLLLKYLLRRNPFETQYSASLRNIATGVTAPTNVNADQAKEVGQNSKSGMKMSKFIHSFCFRD